MIITFKIGIVCGLILPYLHQSKNPISMDGNDKTASDNNWCIFHPQFCIIVFLFADIASLILFNVLVRCRSVALVGCECLQFLPPFASSMYYIIKFLFIYFLFEKKRLFNYLVITNYFYGNHHKKFKLII